MFTSMSAILLMYTHAFPVVCLPKFCNNCSRLVSPGAKYKLILAFLGEKPTRGASPS